MRILNSVCRSQSVTSKTAPKGLSIVFHISQSININYFPQNMLEVSFIFINTNIRSLCLCFQKCTWEFPQRCRYNILSIYCQAYILCFSDCFHTFCFLRKLDNRSEGCYIWRSSWPKSL
jgi:hypothetical protein